MAPDRTPAPRQHADQDHRRCSWLSSCLSPCLDTGVGAVETAVEGDAGDLEAGDGEHRLEQPAVGAELVADVLGVVAGGVTVGRVGCGILQPAGKAIARPFTTDFLPPPPRP